MRLLALFCVIVLSLSACNLPLKPVSSTPPIYLTIAAASAGTAIATNPATQTPEIVTATPEATGDQVPAANARQGIARRVLET